MDKFTDINQFLDLLQGVVEGKPGNWKARCPSHDDKNPSLHITLVDDAIAIHCFAGCEPKAIMEAIGKDMSCLYLDTGEVKRKPGRPAKEPTDQEKDIEATYDYTNAEGDLIFQVVRYKPKDFRQRRPDGKGGWIKNLEGITPMLYHLPELAPAISEGIEIIIVEGEKDCETLRNNGFVATCGAMGAGKWREHYVATLVGAKVVIIADADDAGRKHASQVAGSLWGKAIQVKLMEFESDKDTTDWFERGGTPDQLREIFAQVPEYEPTKLEDILARCCHWLYMPENDDGTNDTGSLEVILGAIAANMLPGDPVWLLLVGVPGSGKTELLNAIANVKNVWGVSVLTEASLLSGTPKRQSQGAKGGLLNEMGGFGIIQIKDFGSVLSLNKDSRGPILAGMREIFDGSWTRYVGSDAGRKLGWKGKCGLVGGATPSIDSFYQVMNVLGERFCYYRLNEASEDKKARKALEHAGHEGEMRMELSSMVADFFNSINIAKPISITNEENTKLINLAMFTTRCRSAVERESGYTHDITLVPGVEAPTRFVKILAQLLRGLQVIGVPRERAWVLVEKVALDSMPQFRQKVIQAMVGIEGEVSTSELAANLDYPTITTKRTLEDLTCYQILNRHSQGQGSADMWSTTDWTRTTYKEAIKELPFTQIRKKGK